MSCVMSTYLYGAFDCIFFLCNAHVLERIYILHCLNFKERLARKRRNIWRLSECNGIRTHNYLVCKWILNHLAKPAKWLSCVVSTYRFGAFDCMFLTCHVRVNLHSTVAWMSRNSLLEKRHDIWSLNENNGIRTRNHVVLKRTLNHLPKLAKWLSCLQTNWLWVRIGTLFTN